ncbi:hypothetical protein [Brevibacillus brevis]|uniref:hypothetical protein n=1 Tax=Brevibacillus brevis TaxID=1393 RepID=UPI001C8E5CC2|nr:hypothetical protein [Brevibacillus brevis]MBY0088257.1 hypothetical protein [Brevibacillus brevis]
MAEDVARFLERGKLAPEQYVGITGEGYEASVVDQQEKVLFWNETDKDGCRIVKRMLEINFVIDQIPRNNT